MTTTQIEHLDVLIVGAGISGIGAARYLGTELPSKSFAILEARDSSGGTWDLFRYPGIRSDSDLHTFGYEFKPWLEKESIASAPKILNYLRETIDEYGIEPRIRYRHKVIAARWSTPDARWTVEIENPDTGESATMTCTWLFCAGGYYNYDQGFDPGFAGRERFGGTIVHPQHWPEDLDYTGKRVLVIGSGATAVTLVPSIAETAAHVTMVQRTPSYVIPIPRTDPIANLARRVAGNERGYAFARRKNIFQQRLIWDLCRRRPALARRIIRKLNAWQLPDGYPVDVHFNPPYDPWDQRLCMVPDGDLFKAISAGTASVVTDGIDSFTETGIRLTSGTELDADIIVTATGLNVKLFGGITLTVDGTPVDFADTLAYKGMMVSTVPNFTYAIGYTNLSWTLKIGLLCQQFCRLLSYMDTNGHDICTPTPTDLTMPTKPFLDFDAGYVKRALHQLPKQGDRMPWLTSLSYYADVEMLRTADFADPELHFARATVVQR